MNIESLFKSKTELDTGYIEHITEKANAFHSDISREWDVIDDFYFGDHWSMLKDITTATESGLLINARTGKPMWDGVDNPFYSNNNEENDQMPKRTVNLIKTYIESLVAQFTEVNPIPTAVPASNLYDYKEILTPLNLLLKEIFQVENKGKELYQELVRDAIKYGYSIGQVMVDKEKTRHVVPIKLRAVSPRDIRIDPKATHIDEADYVIQYKMMTLGELNSKYDFKIQRWLLNGETHEDDEEFEVKKIWVRTNIDGNNEWRVLNVLGEYGVWLKNKEDKKGNFLNTKYYPVYPRVPFVVFKTSASKNWAPYQSIVIDAIEPQIDYNKTLSEGDYNWLRSIKPIIVGNAPAEKVEEGNKPGGYIPLDTANGEQISFEKTDLIDQGSIRARLDTVKEIIGLTFGNVEILEGRKPTGTYSDKLMQTMIRIAQLKPKMWESMILDAWSELGRKAIEIWAERREPVVLFDPDYMDVNNGVLGRKVTVTERDVRNELMKIEIEVNDANLSTPDALMSEFKELLQYGNMAEASPGFEYILWSTYNKIRPGAVPTAVLEEAKKLYLLERKNRELELNEQQIEMENKIAQLKGQPAQNEMGSSVSETELNQAEDDARAQLEEIGVWEGLISQMGKDPIKEIRRKGEEEGRSTEEIIGQLQNFTDKSKNILYRNQPNGNIGGENA